MRKYIAKPFTVEALEYQPGVESEHICNEACEVVGLGFDLADNPHVHHSLEGERDPKLNPYVLNPGDFIVKNGDLVFGLARRHFQAAYGEARGLLGAASDAYLAYGAVTKYRNFQGNPMPAFDDLPETIQKAWMAVAVHFLGKEAK